MGNIKKLVLAVILCCIGAFAANAKTNYVNGLITLKSGEKIECMIDDATFYADKVKYRLSPKDKEKKLLQTDIHTIVFPDDEGNYSVLENIAYVSSKNYLKGEVKKLDYGMKNVVEYGDVSLFRFSVKEYEGASWMSTTHYYTCRKKGVDYGVSVGYILVLPQGITKKKVLIKTKGDLEDLCQTFFGDYPDLCKQIREKKLTMENIEDIVHEYNVYKAEKSGK